MFSIHAKRKIDIPFTDSSKFIDFTSYSLLDSYSVLAMCISCVFYPFRLFLFLSRFSSAKGIVAHLNSMARTAPGIGIYISIVATITICVTVCSMLILGPFIPDMREFRTALLFTASNSLMDQPDF